MSGTDHFKPSIDCSYVFCDALDSLQCCFKFLCLLPTLLFSIISEVSHPSSIVQTTHGALKMLGTPSHLQPTSCTALLNNMNYKLLVDGCRNFMVPLPNGKVSQLLCIINTLILPFYLLQEQVYNYRTLYLTSSCMCGIKLQHFFHYP